MPGEELAFQDRFTVWVGAAVPVPVSDSVVVEGEASLETVKVALAAPAVCGLNVIVKGTLWPAATVTGRGSPPTLKTELLVLAAVTVTLAPVALNVPEAVPLVPSTTLPTPSVVGETFNWPTVVVPIPDTEIVRDALDAVDVRVTAPFTLPDEVGANVTSNVALCPAVSVTGALIPPSVNPAPLMLACEMVTLELPELVTLPERDCVFPMVTLPKLRLFGVEPRIPDELCVPVPPALTPWQPSSNARPANSNIEQTSLRKFFKQTFRAGSVICRPSNKERLQIYRSNHLPAGTPVGTRRVSSSGVRSGRCPWYMRPSVRRPSGNGTRSRNNI